MSSCAEKCAPELQQRDEYTSIRESRGDVKDILAAARFRVVALGP